MNRFDRITRDSASRYPGHIIVVGGDCVRITARLASMGGQVDIVQDQPLEAVIHLALLVRQRDALPVGVLDEDGLWPARLGELVHWDAPVGAKHPQDFS